MNVFQCCRAGKANNNIKTNKLLNRQKRSPYEYTFEFDAWLEHLGYDLLFHAISVGGTLGKLVL